MVATSCITMIGWFFNMLKPQNHGRFTTYLSTDLDFHPQYVHHILVGGIPTPSDKYEFVTWDDEIPNIWNVIQNSMVPDHQPVITQDFPHLCIIVYPIFSIICPYGPLKKKIVCMENHPLFSIIFPYGTIFPMYYP